MKKPCGGRPVKKEMMFDVKLSSGLVLMERFFRLEACCWSIMKRKFCLYKSKYDVIAIVCRALTSCHIIHN